MEDERLDAIWDEIWSLLEEGRSDEAAARSLRALNEDGDEPELHYLLGVSLLDLDEVEAAVPELEKAAQGDPGWSAARAALAWAYFRACRFDEARGLVSDLVEQEPDLAEAHQLAGLLAERSGDDEAAAKSFARAQKLDPERYPVPVHMDEEEFLEVAREAVRELDDVILGVLEETSFFVQDVPSDEILAESDPPLDPQLLGLFVGRNLLEQSVQDSGVLPNTMYLFKKNLERATTTREELEEEIRITVLHEIGHHLGWGEEELEAKGFG